MTSSQHGLYVQGYTHATMAGTMGRQPARGSQSNKAGLSSDCRLQLACMKSELLVTARQHSAVNTFPGLVHTARHVMELVTPENSGLTVRRQLLKVGLITGTKS